MASASSTPANAATSKRKRTGKKIRHQRDMNANDAQRNVNSKTEISTSLMQGQGSRPCLDSRPVQTFKEFYKDFLANKTRSLSLEEVSEESQENIEIDNNYLIRTHFEAKKAHLATLPMIIKNNYREHPDVAAMSDILVQKWRKNSDITTKIFMMDELPIDKIPNPVLSLEQAFYKNKEIIERFKTLHIKKPTTVQAQAWPVLLSGQDLTLLSPKCKGKLMAYILPACIHIINQPIALDKRNGPNVLIIAPTTDLVLQIKKEYEKISMNIGIKLLCIYGETCSVTREQLNRVHLIIATPRRLCDLRKADIFDAESITFIVLDEVDRMLDMGSEPHVRLSISPVREDAQKVITSASLPELRIMRNIISKNFVEIVEGKVESYAVIHQEVQFVVNDFNAKFSILMKYINGLKKKQKLVVFCSLPATAYKVSTELGTKGFDAQCICKNEHIAQGLEDMRNGTKILITVDSLSRGLDIDNITDIINFDFPDLNEYVHRLGRVRRASQCGCANVVTFICRANASKANALIIIFKESKQVVPPQLANMAELFLNRRRASRNHYRESDDT